MLAPLCHSFAAPPQDYELLGHAFQRVRDVTVGRVNCEQDKPLCERFDVKGSNLTVLLALKLFLILILQTPSANPRCLPRLPLRTPDATKGYPTLMWFPRGTVEGVDYKGGRTSQEMMQFVNEQTGMKARPKRRPNQAS